MIKLYFFNIIFGFKQILKNLFKYIISLLIIKYIYKGNIQMGIGDWGLGIGDWGLGPIPNPQSPIPNPHPHF
jgi:hypothetical protein